MTGACRGSWRSWHSLGSSVFSCVVLLGALVAAGVTGGAMSAAALATTGTGAGAAGAASVSHTSGATDASYAVVDSSGGVTTWGGAGFNGDLLGTTLARPIVGSVGDPEGGYWLVASDGGVFAFGHAEFYGSTGNLALNQPIVGMTPTPDGNGYWLVASDSGIFTFGDAVFSGSAQSPLHPPFFPAPLTVAIPGTVSIFNDVPGPQAMHPNDAGIMRVAFAGDSIALYEGQYTINNGPPYLTDNGAAAGCGFTNGAPQHLWSKPASTFIDPGACALWMQQLQWVVTRFHPDVTVLQAGYWESQPRLYNGSYQTLADQDYSSYIASNLTEAIDIARSDGGAVIVGNALYDADGTPNNLVDAYNQIVRSVAAQFPGVVSVLDTHTALDPGNAYAASIDGVGVRGADGVHITQAAVSDFIGPALSQLIANVGPVVYNGSS